MYYLVFLLLKQLIFISEGWRGGFSFILWFVCVFFFLVLFPPNRFPMSIFLLISVDCYYIGNMEEQLTVTGLLQELDFCITCHIALLKRDTLEVFC